MAGVGPMTQDWEPVVFRKKAPNAAAKKDEKAVNAARRTGAEIETIKKSNAGTNKAASSSTSLNTRKLDDETENLSPVVDLDRDCDENGSSFILHPQTVAVRLLSSVDDANLDERVSTDLKKNIMQARMDKKLTQSQLAQQINEKPQVIQEYESGKAIPNQQIITKLERVLGTKLRARK